MSQPLPPEPQTGASFVFDADNLCSSISQAAANSRTESELQTACLHLIASVFDKNSTSFEPALGKYIRVTGQPGRYSDMMFGRVIIEFERPGFLATTTGLEHATQQVIDYIEKEEPSPEEQRKWVGIVLDGRLIRFVRREEKEWLLREAEPLNPQNVTLMMHVLRGLNRWPLRADQLSRVFGSNSSLAHDTIRSLLQHLTDSSPGVGRLFAEWRHLFGQVAQYNLEQIPDLKVYTVACPNADASQILFALHTYYALIIKLVCAELATVYTEGTRAGYLERLAVMPIHELKDSLIYLEDGGTLYDLGVRNVLEGDFFSWYLQAWDTDLANAISKLIQSFQRFEATEALLEPASTQDLLRQLYHQLIPHQLRHDLGEVYTPRWLAEQVLNDLDYHGEADQRLLDPSGGTGMFIMVAMQRLRVKNASLSGEELLELILRNLIIFDLNPLAVVAARMNYLLNLGPLLKYRPRKGIEIPVYLADSVFAPSIQPGTSTYTYKLNTAAGIKSLAIPARFVENGVLSQFMTTIERAVIYDWTEELLIRRLAKDLNVTVTDMDSYSESVCALYETLRSIGIEDRLRHVYTRIVKNYFTSVTVGRFHKICGNPPWLRWSRLPEQYRRLTFEFCRAYGLFSQDSWVGGIETDISIMLTYAVSERWLLDCGSLGFLITQTVFKSESAEGFRKFTLPDGTPLKVLFVRDLVSIKPFAGIANRTALFVLQKGVPTTYPVPYEVWQRTTPRTRIGGYSPK